MQMRPDVQIASMIKALEDTILPVIPPGQGLAVDQCRLVVGMLKLMACQLPLQFAFDRDELSRLLDCCDGLAETMVRIPGDGHPRWGQSYYYNAYDPVRRLGVFIRLGLLENQGGPTAG